MGLQLRMTFNDTDYVYEIINSKLTDQTTELELMLQGEKVELLRDKNMIWTQCFNFDKIQDRWLGGLINRFFFKPA